MMASVGVVRSEARASGALWFVLASVVCALVAAYAAVSMVHAVRRVVPVVVARREVSPLTLVTARDVVIEDVPAAAIPPDALRAESGVVGQVTRLGLAPGEVVTGSAVSGGIAPATAFDARLARMSGTGACVAAGLQPVEPAPVARARRVSAPHCPDLVGVSLPLDADQGYQLVRAGDRVDVAATYTLQSGPVSQIIVSDVPVLFKSDGAAGPGGASWTGAGPAAPLGATAGWLVLGATAQQALRLKLAEDTGKVSVFLCPLGVSGTPPGLDHEVVTTEDLAGGAPAASATPAYAGQLP